MKGGLKVLVDRVDSSNLDEDGTDASSKTLYTMKHGLVDSNSACLPVQTHKRSADTTPGIVAVDVSADDTRSVAQTSAVKVTERRAMKRRPKNKRKDAKRRVSQKEVPGGIGGNPTSGTTLHRQSKVKHTTSQVDAPSRVVENPNSEDSPRGQNQALEVEDTKKLPKVQNSLSTSKIKLYNCNQAVII